MTLHCLLQQHHIRDGLLDGRNKTVLESKQSLVVVLLGCVLFVRSGKDGGRRGIGSAINIQCPRNWEPLLLPRIELFTFITTATAATILIVMISTVMVKATDQIRVHESNIHSETQKCKSPNPQVPAKTTRVRVPCIPTRTQEQVPAYPLYPQYIP